MAPPRPLGLHHAAVVVASLTRAEAFYVDLLGLSVLRRFDDDRGLHRSTWVDLGAGDFLAIEILPAGGSQERPSARVGHHCLALRMRREDRRAWVEHLTSRGVEVERSTPFSIFFRDPDGALVALSHHPELAEDPADRG